MIPYALKTQKKHMGQNGEGHAVVGCYLRRCEPGRSKDLRLIDETLGVLSYTCGDKEGAAASEGFKGIEADWIVRAHALGA